MKYYEMQRNFVLCNKKRRWVWWRYDQGALAPAARRVDHCGGVPKPKCLCQKNDMESQHKHLWQGLNKLNSVKLKYAWKALFDSLSEFFPGPHTHTRRQMLYNVIYIYKYIYIYSAQDLGSRVTRDSIPARAIGQLAYRDTKNKAPLHSRFLQKNREGTDLYKGNVLEKDYRMGRYIVCSCGQHWLWEDKVQAHPTWKCKGCNRPWISQLQKVQGKPKEAFSYKKERKSYSWPRRTYKAALLEPPPGLSQPKGLKNKQWKSLEGAAMQHWDSLPEAFKETLGGMGINKQKEEKPTDLKEILKQHLAALPEGLKSQLEGIIHPKVETTEKSAAAKMKASIGTLRDLSNRRDGAQAKVDQSKEQYKTALQDLQDLQKQIDLTQEELKQTTAEYARIAMQKKIEEIPMDTKVEEETMWQLMEQVGITVDEDKKEQLQKLLEENQTKRRKTGPERGQKCG